MRAYLFLHSSQIQKTQATVPASSFAMLANQLWLNKIKLIIDRIFKNFGGLKCLVVNYYIIFYHYNVLLAGQSVNAVFWNSPDINNKSIFLKPC